MVALGSMGMNRPIHELSVLYAILDERWGICTRPDWHRITGLKTKVLMLYWQCVTDPRAPSWKGAKDSGQPKGYLHGGKGTLSRVLETGSG
jgi:hypothetical protein